MASTEILSASNYQTFIQRAYKCGEGKHGARRGFFQNLYRAERGESAGLFGGSFNEQFKDIKYNISKALDEFSKSEEFREELTLLNNRLRDCKTVNCLSEIIDEGLDLTKPRI